MVVLAFHLGGAARAEEPAGSARPPVCRAVRRAIRQGSRRHEIVGLIKGSVDVTEPDVACLRADDSPSYAVRVAQAQLVKRHGLEALPTGPVDVWAVLPDPKSIAAAQPGLTGIKANLGLLLGMDQQVQQQTLDTILQRAREGVGSTGIDADVTLEAMSLAASDGVFWSQAGEQHANLAAGTYYVLHVHIPDAIAAARAYKGDFAVGIGARVGVDVEATVDSTVRQEVWSQLAASGVQSVLVNLDAAKP